MVRTFAWLLALALLGLPLGGWAAAEDPPGGKPAPKEGDKPDADKPDADKPDADKPDADKPGADEPDDGADDKVPFGEEINRAIEQGVSWLKAKPRLFPLEEGTAAHWGLINGDTFYGGGDGKAYRHPAGPTALALYALLKCGVDPKDPVIEEGFHWLRVEHAIIEENDGQDQPSWRWRHAQAGSSYEVSVMILALCAKYDHYKRNKNSADGVKRGKLKIGDKADLEWLQELVQGLVERRGMPAEGLEEQARLGWRYNAPLLKWTRTSGGGGRGGRTNTETFTRETRVPPHANQDISSTQLAALALFTAHRYGVKVEPQVWWDILTFVLSHQEEDGPEHERHDPGYQKGGYAAPKDKARGFMYIKGSPDKTEGKATGSMTACGLGTILLCKEVLCETDKGRKLFLEKKMDSTVERATNDALAWHDKNWSSFQNPVGNSYPIYYLYSLERAMDMLNRNLVGKHLWYTEGARSILDNAKKAEVDERLKKGTRKVPGMYWETGATLEPKDVLDTCFALLFLKRATKGLVPAAPVTGGDGAPADNR